MLILWKKWQSNQVSILDVSHLLGCRGLCRNTTWSHCSRDIKATWIFTKFGLLAHKVFVRWVPGPWPSQQAWYLRRWQAPLRDMIHVTGKQHRNWQRVTDGVRLITQLILGLCPANERRRYKRLSLAGSKPRIIPELYCVWLHINIYNQLLLKKDFVLPYYDTYVFCEYNFNMNIKQLN